MTGQEILAQGQIEVTFVDVQWILISSRRHFQSQRFFVEPELALNWILFVAQKAANQGKLQVPLASKIEIDRPALDQVWQLLRQAVEQILVVSLHKHWLHRAFFCEVLRIVSNGHQFCVDYNFRDLILIYVLLALLVGVTRETVL